MSYSLCFFNHSAWHGLKPQALTLIPHTVCSSETIHMWRREKKGVDQKAWGFHILIHVQLSAWKNQICIWQNFSRCNIWGINFKVFRGVVTSSCTCLKLQQGYGRSQQPVQFLTSSCLINDWVKNVTQSDTKPRK